MYRILIVEDEPIIADAMSKHLSMWDYEVSIVVDFKEVMTQFANVDPHLVILDSTLPFKNGYHWCGEIRKRSRIPVLLLSSATENMNIVMAMDMGADDFMTKPFDLTVLSAKVNALIRRAYAFGGQMHVMEHEGVLLNLNDTTVTYGEQSCELTKNEFKILKCLFEQPGQVVSRDLLMMRLWESEQFVDDNTLTVNLGRLRKKMSALGLEDFVETKKGMGYRVK